jgi:hypothetical protein
VTTALAWCAIVCGVASAGCTVVLALRRLALARQERRRAEAEARLRPLAVMLVEGEVPDASTLEAGDAEILAGVLARYSRWLTGDARSHVARFFEREGGVDAEMRALGDRRAWRRATAAYTLGDMASTRAAPALVAALDDHARAVRAAAARSLGRLGAADAAEPLVLALVEGRVPRAVAGQALLAIGPNALPRLAELVDHDDATVRASVIELIGLLGDAAAAAFLLERLRDASAEVRAKAARALGRLAADEAAAGLRAALRDRIPFVRVSAAHALGMVGDRDSVGDLLRVARADAVPDVAQAASGAVGRIAPDLLLRAATVPDAGPHVHEAADLLELRA